MRSAGSEGGDGGGREGSDPARRLPLPSRARVTLQAAVTPLALPNDEGRASLELDTSELPSPPPVVEPSPAPPARAAEPPRRPSLELDLDDLDLPARSAQPPPVGAAKVAKAGPPAAHDAWTQDRLLRRGTPPVPFPAAEQKPEPDATAQAKQGVRVSRVVSVSSDARPLHPATGGGALDLVERPHAPAPEVDFATEMNDRFALGDFTGALLAAELFLGREPGHAEARRVAAASRERLVQLYTSRLGPLDRAPRVVLPETEIRWLGLDNRSGFLLSLIDGRATVEEIIDVSGMSRLETLRTLAELIAVGVVAL